MSVVTEFSEFQFKFLKYMISNNNKCIFAIRYVIGCSKKIVEKSVVTVTATNNVSILTLIWFRIRNPVVLSHADPATQKRIHTVNMF